MLYMVLHIKSSKNPIWVLLDVRLEITRCQKGNSQEFLKSNMSVHELRLLNWIKKIVTVYIVCVDILWSAQPIVFLRRNLFMLECVNKRCAFVHRAGAHFLYIQQGTTVPIGLLLLMLHATESVSGSCRWAFWTIEVSGKWLASNSF